MLQWLQALWGLLRNERKVIKGAPIHFAFAVLICLILAFTVCFAALKLQLALRKGTVDAYKERYGELGAPLKDASGTVVQVLIYTNHPNADKLIPPVTNAPALAYPLNAEGAMFFWDIRLQAWK